MKLILFRWLTFSMLFMVALAAVSQEAPNIQALFNQLRDPKSEVRHDAVDRLNPLLASEHRDEVVNLAILHLDDSSFSVRLHSIGLLRAAMLFSPGDEALRQHIFQPVFARIQSKNHPSIVFLTELLGEIGNSQAIPRLKELFPDAPLLWQRAIAGALAELSRAGHRDEILPWMLAELDSRLQKMETLGRTQRFYSFDDIRNLISGLGGADDPRALQGLVRVLEVTRKPLGELPQGVEPEDVHDRYRHLQYGLAEAFANVARSPYRYPDPSEPASVLPAGVTGPGEWLQAEGLLASLSRSSYPEVAQAADWQILQLQKRAMAYQQQLADEEKRQRTRELNRRNP